MQQEVNIYKLINSNIKGGWQLPINGVMLPKKINGKNQLKSIHYVPDADSMWVEDYKGDQKPESVWFERGILRVSKFDVVLNEILENHHLKGVDYEKFDEQESAEKEYEEFEVKQEAIELIRNAEEHKVLAIAMTVFNFAAGDWPAKKARVKLSQYAENKAVQLIDLFKSSNTDGRYLSALALKQGIVKANATHTAIVWNDENGGQIIPIAKGESMLNKFSTYLNSGKNESEVVIQEIASRLENEV